MERGHYTTGNMHDTPHYLRELSLVASATGQVEAEILRGLLLANGIEVWLSGESAGQAIGLTMGPLARVELRVRSNQAGEARRLLEEHAADSLIPGDA